MPFSYIFSQNGVYAIYILKQKNEYVFCVKALFRIFLSHFLYMKHCLRMCTFFYCTHAGMLYLCPCQQDAGAGNSALNQRLRR